MKRRALAILLTAAVLIVLSLLATGAYATFDNIFPKAEPLSLPESGDILAFTIVTDTGKPISLTSDEQAALLQSLRTAQPTRKMTLNDVPDVRPYTQIDLTDSVRDYRIFVYEEAAQVFVDIPYTGIYCTDQATLSLLTP